MLFPRLYTVCCARASSPAADSTTCTREIMQQVMDFFSGNAHGEPVRQHNALAQADALAQAIVTAFDKASVPHESSRYRLADNFIVEYCGCKVTFSLPAEHNPDSLATIEVSRDGDSVTAAVDRDRYCCLCTTLILRQNFYHPSHRLSLATLLTGEGSANLRQANFYDAKIQDVSLPGVDLQGVVLINTLLSGADLRRANLQNIRAERVNLKCADLSGADLKGATVSRSLLPEVNLREASLINTHLDNSDFSDANFASTNLRGSSLLQCRLPRANLRGACLESAFLSEAELNHADLRASNLRDASFERANLTGANLAHCRMERVSLKGAKLKGAILDNIPLSASLLALPPLWDPDTLDVSLNHINNPESGSLLTMMDSIEAKYPQIKVKMARELMASLRTTDVSTVAVALLDVLSKAPWSAEPDIDRWLNGICRDYLQCYNTRVMPANQEGVNRQAVSLFSQQPALMHTFNGAFIQLVAQGMTAENDAHRERIRALYDSYLNKESIRPWAMLDVFSDYSGTGQPDWEDRNVANYIHTSSAPDGHVMLLSHNTLQGMLTPDPQSPMWHCFYLYNCQREELPPGRETPESLFEQHFPLFLAPYQYAQKMACFHKLLSLLKLADLRAPFLDATRARVSQVKLVSEEQRQKLQEIFLPVLELSADYCCCRLREAHYHQIMDVYELSCASDTARARMLLCLALAFTTYSSNAIFGTEEASPEMLRFYACALMEQAYALDQKVFNCEGENQFTEWKNRLLGLDNPYSCSAVLSSMMIVHIREHFPDVLAQVLPPPWY